MSGSRRVTTAPMPQAPTTSIVWPRALQLIPYRCRDTGRDAQDARPVRMWPERVDEGFRRKPWRLDRLLRIHAEHQHVKDHLEICLTLIVAPGTSHRRDRSAVFAN